MIRRASPLLLANPASTKASIIASPSPASTCRGQLFAGDVGEDARQLGVGQLVDFGAEEDFRGPLGRGQPLVAVDQPGQFLGQSPLGRPPPRIGRVLGLDGRESPPGPDR